MEDKLKKAAEVYNNIEIPKELGEIISKEIAKSRKGEYTMENKKMETKRPKVGVKYVLSRFTAAVAAAAAVFVITVNVSETVAYALYDVPVIGEIVKVVTFKEYNYTNDTTKVEVKVPEITGTGNESLEEKVNKEIQLRLDAVITDGEARAEEYKKAFLETGGKEENFRQVPVFADYEKKYVDQNVLSFIINTVVVIGNSQSETLFYNIDLKTGNTLKISDVLGENYKEIADEAINKQIEEQKKNDPEGAGAMYFGGENGIEGFKGITEEQNFFINAEGNVVVKFAKYEIAAGALGMPEFVIGPMVER